jgi:hypothetical protein
VKSNAVAYTPFAAPARKKRGRPKLYGQKLKVKSLLDEAASMQEVKSPVYGEQKVTLRFRSRDLLWRPLGRLARFVAVVHPVRGSCLLMSTDTALDPVEIIRLYGLRFKIEFSFKQAVHRIGTFAYHFWMRDMKPLRRRNGNQYLHREPLKYRDAVKRKMGAYHVFILAGVVAQGLLQYLAAAAPQQVWSCFGSWLRTIRPGVSPSELVVATALRRTLPEFLLNSAETSSFAKFVVERQDPNRIEAYSQAA